MAITATSCDFSASRLRRPLFLCDASQSSIREFPLITGFCREAGMLSYKTPDVHAPQTWLRFIRRQRSQTFGVCVCSPQLVCGFFLRVDFVIDAGLYCSVLRDTRSVVIVSSDAMPFGLSAAVPILPLKNRA